MPKKFKPGEERSIRYDGGAWPAGDRAVDVERQAAVLGLVRSEAVFGKTLHIVAFQAVLKVEEGVFEFCSYAPHGLEADCSSDLVGIVIEVGESIVTCVDVAVIEVDTKHCPLMVEPIGSGPVALRLSSKIFWLIVCKYLCHITLVPFLSLTSLGSPRLPDSPMNKLF